MKTKKRKVLKYTLLSVAVLLLAAGSYMAYWVNDTYKPGNEANEAVVTDEAVTVTEGENIVFLPKETPTKGFIFYPGGLVEPESYAPLCRRIAEEGYLVVIPSMTWNLAVLSPNKAEEIIKDYPDITTWAIGGHSLGGVMAADYAVSHKEIKGVVLYAAYPKDESLKESGLPVLSMYGELDGVADLTKVKEAALPDSAKKVEIAGGNHCYFGDYGMQKGDNEATITPKEQQEKAAKETIAFLKQV